MWHPIEVAVMLPAAGRRDEVGTRLCLAKSVLAPHRENERKLVA